MKSLFFILLNLVSISAQAGYYWSNGIWPDREISVCFAPGEIEIKNARGKPIKTHPISKKDELKVEKWVKEEYSSEKTGISFHGFLPCSELPEAAVVIYHTRNNQWLSLFKAFSDDQGFASIGPNGQGRYPIFPYAKSYIWLNNVGFDKRTTIHEFGHVAGLMHEHYRLEREKDRTCWGVLEVGTPMYPSTDEVPYYGDYDKDSVMSYCSANGFFQGNGGLSEGDRATLRFLYP